MYYLQWLQAQERERLERELAPYKAVVETLKPPTDQEKLLAEIEETLAQSEKLLAQNARFSKKVKKLLGEE